MKSIAILINYKSIATLMQAHYNLMGVMTTLLSHTNTNSRHTDAARGLSCRTCRVTSTDILHVMPLPHRQRMCGIETFCTRYTGYFFHVTLMHWVTLVCVY